MAIRSVLFAMQRTPDGTFTARFGKPCKVVSLSFRLRGTLKELAALSPPIGVDMPSIIVPGAGPVPLHAMLNLAGNVANLFDSDVYDRWCNNELNPEEQAIVREAVYSEPDPHITTVAFDEFFREDGVLTVHLTNDTDQPRVLFGAVNAYVLEGAHAEANGADRMVKMLTEPDPEKKAAMFADIVGPGPRRD